MSLVGAVAAGGSLGHYSLPLLTCSCRAADAQTAQVWGVCEENLIYKFSCSSWETLRAKSCRPWPEWLVMEISTSWPCQKGKCLLCVCRLKKREEGVLVPLSAVQYEQGLETNGSILLCRSTPGLKRIWASVQHYHSITTLRKKWNFDLELRKSCCMSCSFSWKCLFSCSMRNFLKFLFGLKCFFKPVTCTEWNVC